MRNHLRTLTNALVLLSFLAFAKPARAKVLVGDKFPDINLSYLEKTERFDPKSLKSRVRLIDIWASDCYPCRQALPALNQLHKRLNAKGFEVIGISVFEDVSATKEFLKEYKVDYVLLDDSKHELAKSLGVTEMPTSYLVDQSGIVRMINKGFEPSDIKKIEVEANKLLSGKPSKKKSKSK